MITAEQLLASEDVEYMNQSQLAFFKALLLRQRDDLRSSIEQGQQDLAAQEVVADPADRASIEAERLTLLRTRERETKLVHKIEAALLRIELGEYGYCDSTGEPIGLARLLARPTTTLSYEAQRRKEAQEKSYA